jgi:hypothetical protein
MTGMSDRRGISFRDSAITFGFMIGVVAVLSVGLLVLLDPRSQTFWGGRLSELGTAVRALVDQLPWPR